MHNFMRFSTYTHLSFLLICCSLSLLVGQTQQTYYEQTFPDTWFNPTNVNYTYANGDAYYKMTMDAGRYNSAPRSLRFSRRDNNTDPYLTTDNIVMGSSAGVEFSIAYSSSGNLKAGDKLELWVSYDAGSNFSLVTVLAAGASGNNDDNVAFGATGPQTTAANPYVFALPDIESQAQFRVVANYDDNGNNWRQFWIDDLQLTGYKANDIDIMSAAGIIIEDDATLPSPANDTAFGARLVSDPALVRTFTIENDSQSTVSLGALSLTGDAEFSIASNPGSNSLSPGQSTTFQLAFNPTAVGSYTASVSLLNSSLENPYNFVIDGEGSRSVTDSDGDGVADNIDIDDDNDGIPDAYEQQQCINSSLNTTAEVVFLNETFGAGMSVGKINTNTAGVSVQSYCWEDNTSIQSPDECDTSGNLNDGEYTVNRTAQTSTWAPEYWYTGEDHTAGDTNGRMALFNADNTPNQVFYEVDIIGLIGNSPITYEFWAINLDRSDAPCLNGPSGSNLTPCKGHETGPRSRPNVLVEFLDASGNVLESLATGDVPPDDAWHKYTKSFTTAQSEVTVRFTNNNPGGIGNDLGLDDIKITQEYCDIDGDGISDLYDLDNDNDGIPNIHEITLATGIDLDRDGTMLGTAWIDNNNNGMHDSFENPAGIIDTDSDGTPDYLDLDSDNDGIFDALEYDQLGDHDVNGDGAGEGNDVESGIANDELDGDGFLAVIDNNDNDADEDDFGLDPSGNYPNPIDSDGDGIPDYRDIDSFDASNNPANGSDIDTTVYASYDTNNDGVIDGPLTDTDYDGIPDVFDTDSNLYGSPRDITDNYTLFFDGRNDYVDVEQRVINNLSDATLMIWMKVDPSHTGTRYVAGDGGMRLLVNNAGQVQALAADAAGDFFSLSSPLTLTKDRWYHVAAVYSSLDSSFKLYINGEEQVNTATNAVNLRDVAHTFNLGRKPWGQSGQQFWGTLDEIRVFDMALSAHQIQTMAYQELEINGTQLVGSTTGVVIPGVPAANLKLYMRLDQVQDDQVTDETGNGYSGTMYNIHEVQFESAPIPYTTQQDGSITNSNTLSRQDYWDATDITNFDHSIIVSDHNITQPVDLTTVGLLLNPGSTWTVADGKAHFNSHYIDLDGVLDLAGDAQLVQHENSLLAVTSSGYLNRRQEGLTDAFSYNYWSAPIGAGSSTMNNTAFTPIMLRDAAVNLPLQFTNAHTPPVTSPATISSFWIYKFDVGSVYADWDHNGATGAIPAGHGYTMKGSNTAGSEKQYIFRGKPNNGDINIGLGLDPSGTTSFLAGNPYPSALYAPEFLMDNAAMLDGGLQFWHQFSSTSHILQEYDGGYATLTLSGGVAAAQHPDLNGTGVGNLVPTFNVPVAQGFFVSLDNAGTLKYENDQRVARYEALGQSTWFKNSGVPLTSGSTNDQTPGIHDYFLPGIQALRLEMTSTDTAKREILVAFSTDTTDQEDRGYEGKLTSAIGNSDLWTTLNGEKHVIQAYAPVQPSKIVPLGWSGLTNEIYTIDLTQDHNFDPMQVIYLYDVYTDTYTDLRLSAYTFTTTTDGSFEDRFELHFQDPITLYNEDVVLHSNALVFASQTNSIHLRGEHELPQTIKLYDAAGKLVLDLSSRRDELTTGLTIGDIASGVYMLRTLSDGQQQTLKIMMQ